MNQVGAARVSLKTVIINMLACAVAGALALSVYMQEIGFLNDGDFFTYFAIILSTFLLALSGQTILHVLTRRLLKQEKNPALGFALSIVFQLPLFALLIAVRNTDLIRPLIHRTPMFLLIALGLVVAGHVLSALVIARTTPRAKLDKYFRFTTVALVTLSVIPIAMMSFSGGDNTKGDKNVVLITVDSWRFDFNSFMDSDVITPNVSALHENGITFDNFQAHAPYTWASLSSIMTSLESPFHEVRTNGIVLDDKFDTLSEVLADAGYLTFAAADIKIGLMGLTQGFSMFTRPIELAQFGLYGFHQVLAYALPGFFEPYCFGPNNSMPTTMRALEFLRRNRSDKFFLWVHYYKEPHLPYVAPAHYQELYNMGRTSWMNGSSDVIHALGGDPKLKHVIENKTVTEEDLVYFKNTYRAEVTAMDTQLGMILRSLRKFDLMDDTMVILTADHGEDFSERGRYSHGTNLYRGLVQVPMIMQLPDKTRARVSSMARGIDIAPTAVAFAGVQKPDQFHGSNLMPLIAGDGAGDEERWSYSETLSYGLGWPHDQYGFAFTSDKYKYIALPLEEHEELYDLESDSGETINIAEANAEEIARIREYLHEYFDIEDILELVPTKRLIIKKQQRKMLEALGYLTY